MVQEAGDAEVRQGGAEEHRGQLAFQYGLGVHGIAGALKKLQPLPQGFQVVLDKADVKMYEAKNLKKSGVKK